MSEPRKVTIQQMPDDLKKFILTLRNPGAADIFECKTRDEIINISQNYPLEIMSIPHRVLYPDKKAGPIIGYFMVGIALPAINANGLPIDTVTKPIFIYYYLNDHDWREMKDGIKKEVEIRKERFIADKSQLKDLGNAS